MTHHDAILVLNKAVRDIAHKLKHQIGLDLSGNIVASCDGITASLNAVETTHVEVPVASPPVDDTPDPVL